MRVPTTAACDAWRRPTVKASGGRLMASALAAAALAFVSALVGSARAQSPPRGCRHGLACAYLTVSPAQALPGSVLNVTGWAPPGLRRTGTQLSLALSAGPWGGPRTDADTVSVAQSRSGAISATLQVPLALARVGMLRAGTYTLSLSATVDWTVPRHPPSTVRYRTAGGLAPETVAFFAPAPIRIDPAPTWSAVATGAPTAVEAGYPLPVAARTGHPSEIAYCARNTIRVSTSGGRAWQSVSTQGAVEASRRTPYGVAQPATCAALALDPGHAHTIYAAFSTYVRRLGAPPTFTALYETRNGGKTWQPVPAPAGYSPEDYAGVATGPAAVTVMYSRVGAATAASDAVTETSTDGGATWPVSPLGCPTSGACVVFGPYPTASGAMGSQAYEPLLYSPNAGRTWRATGVESLVAQDNPGQAQLATYADGEMLWLSADSGFPVERSLDGGRTWQPVALPPLPGFNPAACGINPNDWGSLTLLPDGSLLAQGGNVAKPVWYMLPPAAARWAAVPSLHAITGQGRLLVADGRVWWIRTLGPYGQTLRLESASLP